MSDSDQAQASERRARGVDGAACDRSSETEDPDSEGDERWRSEGAGRTYYYQSRPGWSQCERVLDAGSGAAQSKEMCSAGELAMAELPAPSGLLSKTLVNFPYPLVPELVHAGVLPCMD